MIRVLKRRKNIATSFVSTILVLSVLIVSTILVLSIFIVIVDKNLALGNPIPSDGYIKITVDSENRTKYGFVYPLTYVFSIPDDATSLKVSLA